MQVTLNVNLPIEFYQVEQWRDAERAAASVGGEVYCWKTCGHENWLERGYSIVDVLGVVVLPGGLPEYIDMADDDASDS